MRARNWSGMAERHNAAAEARAPLLASAGLIRPLSAEEIQASYERWHREREQLRLRQIRFAERCQGLVVGTFQVPSWTSWTHAALDHPPRASMGRTSGAWFWRAYVGARFRRWAGGEIAS